jgi:hypothetical protein
MIGVELRRSVTALRGRSRTVFGRITLMHFGAAGWAQKLC